MNKLRLKEIVIVTIGFLGLSVVANKVLDFLDQEKVTVISAIRSEN